MKKYAVCRDKVLSYLRDNHRSEATIIKYQRILSKSPDLHSGGDITLI